MSITYNSVIITLHLMILLFIENIVFIKPTPNYLKCNTY